MAKSKPGDVTGRAREALAEEHVEELQKRAEEMTLATAEAVQKLETEVIDATNPARQVVVVDAPTKVGAQDKDTVVIRVVENIEAMTLGVGKHYSFKAGQKYEVTRDVARHLEAKGYLAGTY